MSARVERHVERLADRVMITMVSTLVRFYNVRLLPDSVERIREAVEAALREAAIAGKLDTLHPAQTFGPDQSLIDTKPMKTRPPPPKK